MVEEFLVVISFGILMDYLEQFGNSMAFAKHLEDQEFSFNLLESLCIGIDWRVPFFFFTRICVFCIGDHLHNIEIGVVMIGVIRNESTFIECGARVSIFHGKTYISISLSFMATDDLITHPISMEEMKVGILHQN